MTHRTLRLLLAPALLASATATAVAQPSTSVAAAPQTHDWNDVNHVNGTPVPVGETNSYEKDFKRTNISTNPIGLMVGFYGLSASHAINDHVAIRGDVNYYSPVNSDMTGSELGIGVPIYLRRTYQGAFVEPGFIVRNTHEADEYDDGYDDSSDTETFGPQMLLGWHSTWDSGLNISAAFGVGRNLGEGTTYGDASFESSDSEADVFVNGYLRVGYAF